MATYNPNSPTTIGLEWDVATESVTPLSTTTGCAAFLCTSTATETISTIVLPHTWTGPATGFGKLAVDVYDLSDTGAGATPTTTRYSPNVTQANNNMFAPYPWSSVTTTAHTYVDEQPYSDTDYLAFAATSTCRFEFGSTAFTGAVQSVSFEIRAMGYAGGTPVAAVHLYYNGAYVSTLGTLAPPADSDDIGNRFPHFQTYTIGPFTTNPRTGVAWTQADITSFDTAGTGHALNIALTSGLVGVSYIALVVNSGTDKRVATGSTATQTTLPVGTQTGLVVTLAANWSKVNAHSYLLVARRLDDPTGAAQTIIPQIIYLGTAASPWTGASYSATIDNAGFLSSAGAVDTTKTYPFWLGTSGGAISVDSQPYWDIKIEPVHATSTLKQNFTAAVASYKGLTFVAGYTAVPTADLTIKVFLTAGAVQKGGNATLSTTILATQTYLGSITDTQFSQGTVRLYQVKVDLGSATGNLTAADHYIEFSSATTNAWWIGMLDATASHALTGNQTYGGSTNQATVAGVGVAQGDLIARISTAPVAPSSITVTNTTGTINSTSIDYAAISWVNGGALGASFTRWEIDRSEDAAVTWVNIAKITTESTVTFSDYEGKRSNANKYRVRSVRSDGARSDWVTETGTVTPAAVVGSKAVFTTNSASSLTVGYVPHGTEANYQFLSADETVYMRLHNRDYQASFKPLEQRGIRWAFTVQVHTLQAAPSAGAGVQAYTVLRALADSSTPPYLCLHTGDGERFFGTITVGQGHRDLGTGAYFADIVFTETQLAPTAVTV